MISQMLGSAAAEVPDGVAIAYHDEKISYRELIQMVHAAGAGLRRLGVNAGQTVVIALPNCPEFVVAYLATAHIQARVCALDPAAKEQELKECLNDVRPRLILTDGFRAPVFQRLLALHGGAGGGVNGGVDVGANGGAESTVIVVAGSGDLGDPGPFVGFNRLLERSVSPGVSPGVSSETQPGMPPSPYVGEWSYIYSSGSTGRQKLICRTQANQVAEAENITSTAGITSRDVIVCMVPLFHALGQNCCMITAIRAGATLVLMPDGDAPESAGRPLAHRVLELIREHRATVVPGVPVIFEQLSDVAPEVECDLSSVRLFLSGSNFLSSSIAEKFRRRYGMPLRQTYGSSEAGSVAWDCGRDDEVRPDSVGRPLNNVHVQVVDSARRRVPAGTSGELAVKSRAVMPGYVGQPSLNAEVISDGWYFTGDLGMLDDSGRLYITGRANLLIDTGGHKVNPLEVEAVLRSHAMVRDAVLTGVSTTGGDQYLVAVVVPAGAVGGEELIAYCRNKLIDYKVPGQVIFQDELPLSSTGKVLRRQLSPSEVQQARSAGLPGPYRENSIVEYLIRQVANRSEMPSEQISVTMPLIAMGLNSLGAMQLRGAIETDLGVQVSIAEILTAESIADIAANLESRRRR